MHSVWPLAFTDAGHDRVRADYVPTNGITLELGLVCAKTTRPNSMRPESVRVNDGLDWGAR